jgi:hypothetical protein
MSFVIGVPAWGQNYVDLAVGYTIPATIAALRHDGITDARFMIHTDQTERMRAATQEFGADIRAVPRNRGGHHGQWESFKQAHREVIEGTPPGSVAVLLNSDIVMSLETFSVVREGLKNRKVGVSVGVRTSIDHAKPPVGADAETLAQWIWKNRHHITSQCVWGTGASNHPTVVYFEDENGVVMHGFHLTPMFIRKDRNLRFKGTIDDDVLGHYGDGDLYFMTDRQCVFAELSPNSKKHPFGTRLSVDSVLNFGSRRFSKAHIRNFRQCYRILGEGPVDNWPALEILERLG